MGSVRKRGKGFQALWREEVGAISRALQVFKTEIIEADRLRAERTELRQGKRPHLANLAEGLVDSAGPIAAIGENGDLTGLISTSAGVARVIVNFPTGN